MEYVIHTNTNEDEYIRKLCYKKDYERNTS